MMEGEHDSSDSESDGWQSDDSNESLAVKQCEPRQRYLNDALQYSVQTNNAEDVSKLLDRGADPNWKCMISNLTPLHCCVMLNHMDIFTILLDKGADAVAFFYSITAHDDHHSYPYNVLQKQPKILAKVFEKVVESVTVGDLYNLGIVVHLLTSEWKDPTVDYVELFKVFLSCEIPYCSPAKNSPDVQYLDGTLFPVIGFCADEHLFLLEIMLNDAVTAGSADCVRLLLDYGVDVNFMIHIERRISRIPLLKACRFGNLEIVKLLLDSGAKYVKTVLGSGHETPLDLAFNNMQVDIVKFFLSQGFWSDALDRHKLHLACLLGEEEQVMEMIEGGADIDSTDMKGRTLIDMCIHLKNVPLLKRLLQCSNPTLEPVCAYKYDKRDEWQNLRILSKSQYPCPHTSLFLATLKGDVEVLSAILDTTAGEEKLENYCSNSHKLLCLAVVNGHEDVFRLLLDRGVQLSQPPFGKGVNKTAIHYALEGKNLLMYNELIKRGVEISFDTFKMGQWPFSPYIKIIETGNVEAMKAYLGAGGPVACKNGSMFYLSCCNGQFEMVQYLAKHNHDWLSTLGRLTFLFCKWLDPEDIESSGLYHFHDCCINSRSFCNIKMIDVLLNLGCTFTFNDKGRNGRKGKRVTFQTNEDNENFSGPPYKTVSRLLGLTYISQHYLFCRLLQELCGRNLWHIVVEDFLESLLNDANYALVHHLLNCGHKIEKGYALRHRLGEDFPYKVFLHSVESLCHKPLGLRSACRVKIRSVLTQRMAPHHLIGPLIAELPLPQHIKDYLCFDGHFRHSYLTLD